MTRRPAVPPIEKSESSSFKAGYSWILPLYNGQKTVKIRETFMRSSGSWKERVKALKKETFAIYLACRHPRVPWYAKALALLVVGYALSPIDLIPDFIPVLGYLDDMILIPLGIMLVIRMIPAEVLAECRQKAETIAGQATQAGKIAAAAIVLIWILMAALTVWLIMRTVDRP